MKTLITAAAAIIAALTFSMQASAQTCASPETTGSTSCSTSTVDMEIGNLVLINGLANIDFGTSSAAQTEGFCVGSNFGTGITFTFESATGQAESVSTFELSTTNGVIGGDLITYVVEFDDQGTFAAAAATPAEGGTYADSVISATIATATTCAADNASIRLTPDAGDYGAAPAGNYQDTLYITVAPT